MACTWIAILLHYLMLVVFFSMLSQGLDLLRSVLVVTSRSIVRTALPLTYGGPLIIVALCLAITESHGYGTETYCWLSVENGLYWAFAGPAIFIIILNIVIVVFVLRAMQSAHFMNNKPLTERSMSVVRSICVLSPILGLPWLFGILSLTSSHVTFQYLFAITNTIQVRCL
ncbi:adhesion G-protein coupled receptor D1-like [Physella acuta]|uniref:adhesion G-protein coupled receptor D1-like n=1 Tax=Physella acuta TaxID=109671 RepID=UPI0027DE827A|nr:adhesion G-protein coupled receptor D1-like [Physella acuta]